MVLKITVSKPPPSQASPSLVDDIGGDAEIATIIVDGQTYTDWESVYVQENMSGTNAFTFTSVEREPIPGLWSKLQLRPLQYVDIFLGGRLAMHNGIIETRQVSYDATRHHIQLIGFSFGDIIGKSSVDVKDGALDNKSFLEAAQAVLAKHNIDPVVVGKLNSRKFPYLQVNKGETVWDFLESIARPRGVILGTDYLGNFVLIGQHSEDITAQLVEGVNIKSCQCVITATNVMAVYREDGQSQGSDDQNGTASSEMTAETPGTGVQTTIRITPAIVPVRSQDELQEMANNEYKWSEGTRIVAVITVQGWFKPGTRELWRPREEYSVYSPMAMLTNGAGGPIVLKAKTVTFTQDSESGTQTTLELEQPWALNSDRVATPNSPNLTNQEPAPLPPPPVLRN